MTCEAYRSAVYRRFENQVALVTGAAQGIGEAIARRLVAEGAHVVGIDIRAEQLHQLAAELPQFDARQTDLRSADEIRRRKSAAELCPVDPVVVRAPDSVLHP